MSNQTIIERAMLKQYCEKQKEETRINSWGSVIDSRWPRPSAKDIDNRAANDRIALRFMVGYK